MQRGYKPAIEKSKEIKAVLKEIDALDELRRELLERIEELSDGVVTLTELRRDLRFRGTALIIPQKIQIASNNFKYQCQTYFRFKTGFTDSHSAACLHVGSLDSHRS